MPAPVPEVPPPFIEHPCCRAERLGDEDIGGEGLTSSALPWTICKAFEAEKAFKMALEQDLLERFIRLNKRLSPGSNTARGMATTPEPEPRSRREPAPGRRDRIKKAS